MNKIRKLRKDKRLTLDGLSRELQEKENFKISSNALGKYERGLREPKLETWQILANFFNVSVPYLQGVSDMKNWTPEKGNELVKKHNIKEFDSKYSNDEKLLQNVPDTMKTILNNFDDNISLLKAILLSSENKNSNVISMNIDLMFLLSDIINDISQNLTDAYYPSKDNNVSEIDNKKMLFISMGYTVILKDTLEKINDFNSKNEKEKMISMLTSLGTDINDLKKNSNSDETTDKD